MIPALVTAALLAIVAHGMRRGPGIAAQVARMVGRETRERALYGWALGTAVTFYVPAVVALILLDRGDAVWVFPSELEALAAACGLPLLTGVESAQIAMSLVAGAAIGATILLVRRRRGKAPWGLRYRSPAAARTRGEWGGAAAIAVAAGVSEELFFRLALPLAVGLASGNMALGLVVATVAFGCAHRHQGWTGVAATTLIGAALACLYLMTADLWAAMLVHVAIDLNALILRPWLTRPLVREQAAR